MNTPNIVNKAKQQIADIFFIDKERVEQLRIILESEQKRSVSYKEANEIGSQLIGLYECLAGNKRIVKGKNNERR